MTRSTMSSPTPREVRRLASDHDFVFQASSEYHQPRQLGFLPFLSHNLSVPAAACMGIIFTVVAIVYTHSTARQILSCPDWALDESCTPRADDWTIHNLGTVQGIITLLLGIGLAGLAYVALALCESAVWPLLTRQVFTIRELEAYLSTTKGYILSAPRALGATRTIATGVILACSIMVTLLPLAAAPMVGYAFTPTLLPVQLDSNITITSRGGITQLYAQTDPPTSVMVDVLAEYNSWATDPLSEPLPQYRDWYVDRETLSERGSFSAEAIELQTSVGCRPHAIKQRGGDGLLWNAFRTSMTRTRENLASPPLPLPTPAGAEQGGQDQGGSDERESDVWVRSLPQLTIWVDSFTFLSEYRTVATLIFAALNGTIEGGEFSPIMLGNYTGASSIACDVDITAKDDVLTILEADGFVPLPPAVAPSPPRLSSLDQLELNGAAASNKTGINEMLLWFAVAPLLVGSSVDGTQPMFFNSSVTNRAVAYTSSVPERNTWTVDGLQEMILLSVGALAQATSPSSASRAGALNPEVEDQRLTSAVKTLKMDPSRALLLVILPMLIVGVAIAVGVWSVWVHQREGIPVMRMAGTGELLKSAQTGYLRDLASTDAAKTYLPAGEIGAVEVKYGVDREGVVGLARSVRGFHRGPGARKVDFQMGGV